MWTTLEAVDAALSGQAARRTSAGSPVPTQHTPPPALPTVQARSRAARPAIIRNAVVYSAYAGVVLVVQAILFVLLDESSLPTAAPLCLLILPAFAWAAGWLTIGTLYSPGPDGTLDRSPRVGVLICMIPNALLCGAVGVLFAISRLG
jgi:hypothetical protein